MYLNFDVNVIKHTFFKYIVIFFLDSTHRGEMDIKPQFNFSFAPKINLVNTRRRSDVGDVTTTSD